MFSGCQFSLYPMSDRFVDIILPAVDAMGRHDDLRIETDHLSTLVVGPPARVFDTVQSAYAAACQSGAHVVMNALFSRGCPGEPDDPICVPDGPDNTTTNRAPAPPTGLAVDAQFSLYPLGNADYMSLIAEVINDVRQAGVYDGSKHFCTCLSGDLGTVMRALENAFRTASRHTGHVVIHATVSYGSPTQKP